jgi:hypothetical protein
MKRYGFPVFGCDLLASMELVVQRSEGHLVIIRKLMPEMLR